MIDKDHGYIKLNRFSANTYAEFIEALERLKKEGMKSLVLDLRDNGGGILEEAIDIVDEFLGNNLMIVYTEGTNNPLKEYKAKRPGIFETGKLVILMNENSASASEVIAGAIQDHDRGQIIGRRSFGKGLVQEQLYLSDGSALRLTTARYYTPLGRSIQKPYTNGVESYDMELINRIHNKDSSKDSAISTNKAAFKTAKGKTLYGGGGITPDEYIPFDSTLFDTSINKLYVNNAIGNFSYRYFLSQRQILLQYKSIEAYISNYEVPDKAVEDLIKFSNNPGLQYRLLTKTSVNFLKRRIKAMMARIKWNESGYVQVLNDGDENISRGLVYLRD
jgi:carboxyl-terminal processing protease